MTAAAAAAAVCSGSRGRGEVLRALPVGLAGRVVRPRLPGGTRARRACLPRVPARLGARRLDARTEGAREGLHRGGAAGGRAHGLARRRLLSAPAAVPAHRPARPRARLSGAAPARGRPAARQVRQHGRVRAVHEGRGRLRARPGRAAIAREDRACIVEGNTDVLALRQAGFQPVVACMGTALTEQQLRELRRLTTAPVARLRRRRRRRVGDAARHGPRGRAGVRRQGRRAAAGVDPADDPGGFEARLATALPYVLYRTQVEARREEDREAGRRIVTAFLNGEPESLDRQAAWRWANDYFGMPIQIRGGGTASGAIQPSPRLARAGDRLERGALAGVIAYPNLRPVLAEISPDHFWDETSPRAPRAPRRRHAARRPGARAPRRARRLGARRGDRRADGQGVPASAPRTHALGRAPAGRPRADEGAARGARPDPGSGCGPWRGWRHRELSGWHAAQRRRRKRE